MDVRAVARLRRASLRAEPATRELSGYADTY
jgi:hypothetical protein